MMQILLLISVFFLLPFLFIILYVKLAPQFGARAKGEMLDRIKHSPNFVGGKFQNLVPTTLAAPDTIMLKNGIKFLKRVPFQYPDHPIETVKFDQKSFIQGTSGIKVCWFGHSTLILHINGKIILTDPVFSLRASPFSFAGIKSFPYSNPYKTSDIPETDLVLISHDHFDHLDYKTIVDIHPKVKMFGVPLGIGSHLLRWGVPKNKIIELDWGESTIKVDGLELFSTPSRHFSGRAGIDRDLTLWCSWVIKGGNHRIYFTGDSGYGDHFKKIGDEHGPFDLTIMECGQYNEGWPFIHMNPEESVQAHIDLKGISMLPIHWGKFKLSLHTWTEPMERAKKEAGRLNVNLLNPVQGQCFVAANKREG
jgi:L-ascorbate metabolism protein UlaG (beta-lactamase superfamily)